MHLNRTIRSAIIFSLIIIATTAIAQTDTITINKDSVYDGPFIAFSSDTTLTIDYICHGEHFSQTVPLHDSALVPALCYDFLPGDLFVYAKPLVSSQSRPEHVDRVMAVSDIHGDYDPFVNFLKTTQIIDDSLDWNWGNGHLVIDGDLFDRGAKVYELLWMIYRLQRQAEAAGGAVHFLMGNHELMMLQADERYLNPKFTEVTLPALGRSHSDLVSPNTVIGQWLRSLPAIVVLDSLLFVHGGISPTLMHAGLSIDEINQASLRYFDLSRDEVKADALASLLYRTDGPFWYRNLVWAYNDQPQITRPELDSILDAFGVNGIVVGHSEHDSLTSLFDNRVFAIDIPVDELGGFEGLLVDSQIIYRVKPSGERIRLGPLGRTPPAASELH